MKNLFFYALSTLLFSCWACTSGPSETAHEDLHQSIAEILYPEGRAKLLILGTFHFDDAGLDAFKPSRLDILGEQKQQEIAEVVDKLAQFAPTKIAIESRPSRQGRIDSLYQAYLSDELELKASEVYQLGFRLAKRLGHERLYGVDAPARWFDNLPDIDSVGFELGQEKWLKAAQDQYADFEKVFMLDDSLKNVRTIREHMLFLNDPVSLTMEHGVYVLKDLAVGDQDRYPKADGFPSAWYNRNLRIFGNLLRVIESPDDRVLLIIGSGHVPIIRFTAQSSPDVELVEVGAVLK